MKAWRKAVEFGRSAWRATADYFQRNYDLPQIKRWIDGALYKPVPRHVNWAYSFGMMAMFLFIVQVTTGALLALYYKASAADAYESVKFITNSVRLGWLVHQVHAWSANLMILFVILHMVKTYVTGGFRAPRELTWITGAFLLFVTLAYGFTGYLLPWDQLSYWGTTVGTEITGAIPLVGGYLKTVLRAGEDVNAATLPRFFAIHSMGLLLVMAPLLVAHLLLVRNHGIAPLTPTTEGEPSPEQILRDGGIAFFPHHLLKEAAFVYVLLAVLVTLAVFVPFPLHDKADPFRTPEGIKPEWYYMPAYQLLKYVPKAIGIIGMTVGAVLFIILPFIDRSPERHPRKRKKAMWLGVAVVGVGMLLMLAGYLSESTHTIFGKRMHFDLRGVPHVVVDTVGVDTSGAPAQGGGERE